MQDRLRISCSRENLQQVRDFVRGFLLAAKGNELQVNQVVLAVDEVVANFIIHANNEDASQFLDLLLEKMKPQSLLPDVHLLSATNFENEVQSC